MSSVLDKIFRRVILEGSETINTNWESPAVSIDGVEQDFSVSMLYDDGNSVEMTLWIQVSNDGINFSNVTGSNQNITEDAGSHIWDIAGSGTVFLRVFIEVTNGSIDVSNITLVGNRRH